MTIEKNIESLREEIEKSAARAGRNPRDILLIAAAKTNTAQAVREAVSAGVDGIGENRVQEMLAKMAEGAYLGTELHFIGHLQKNKVKHVVGKVSLIQSVDSIELLNEIDRQAERLSIIQKILLEINIAGEPTKHGFLPGELKAAVEKAASLKHISVEGLMAIPPIQNKPGENREYFSSMHKLFVDIKNEKADNNNIKYLSMGMSQDFVDAIEEGSNMIRVGTLIFGNREYNGKYMK